MKDFDQETEAPERYTEQIVFWMQLEIEREFNLQALKGKKICQKK